MQTNTNLWIEKYRVTNLDEIVYHDNNITTIKSLLNNNIFPNMIFYGPSGIGKTTIILAIAKQIYGNDFNIMTLIIDSINDRGITIIRDEIKEFIDKKPMFNKSTQLIIIDDVDSITIDAQFALRRIIEKYSSSIRFCFICNNKNKIIPAIQSRCMFFYFGYIPDKDIYLNLTKIIKKENINVDNNIILLLSTLSSGDMRKAINNLQLISLFNNSTNIEQYCYTINRKIHDIEIQNIINLCIDDDLLNNKDFIINIIRENNLFYIYDKLLSFYLDKYKNIYDDNFINFVRQLSSLEKKTDYNNEDLSIINLILLINKYFQ
jgi:replication factor C subunit 3/5